MRSLFKLNQLNQLNLREACLDDAYRIWQWRHSDGAYLFYEKAELTPLEAHVKWLRKALLDPSRCLLIVEFDDKPVAHIRFDLDGSFANVSICMATEAKGKSLSKPSLKVACDFIASKGCAEIHARIHEKNLPSIKLFESLSFELKLSKFPFLDYYIKTAQ